MLIFGFVGIFEYIRKTTFNITFNMCTEPYGWMPSDGQKLGQRSMGSKREKICSTVKQLYLFICKHISFSAKYGILEDISRKNILKNTFYLLTLKWGQMS